MQGRERAVVVPPLPRLCPKHILSAPQFLQGALFAFVLKQLMASHTLLCSEKVGISIASSSCARWGVSCLPAGLKSLVHQALPAGCGSSSGTRLLNPGAGAGSRICRSGPALIRQPEETDRPLSPGLVSGLPWGSRCCCLKTEPALAGLGLIFLN